MRRVVGIDIHRTFGEVVYWEDGRLRHGGRVDMTRTALEGFGKSLTSTEEVVIEATGNRMAVSRVLSPFVRRVVIANPLQVRAIAQAHVKTDKIDAGTLANLYAAGYLPEIWTPDEVTDEHLQQSAEIILGLVGQLPTDALPADLLRERQPDIAMSSTGARAGASMVRRTVPAPGSRWLSDRRCPRVLPRASRPMCSILYGLPHRCSPPSSGSGEMGAWTS
nr:IS110 family transposase [Rhizobium sp. Khangiran2]